MGYATWMAQMTTSEYLEFERQFENRLRTAWPEDTEWLEDAVICVYNTERFPPTTIQDVVRAHPQVLADGKCGANSLYEHPDDFGSH